MLVHAEGGLRAMAHLRESLGKFSRFTHGGGGRFGLMSVGDDDILGFGLLL